VLWGAKGKAGVLDDVTITVDLRNEKASHWPFGSPDRRSRFEPQRVALGNVNGEILEELLQPRSSFQGHTLETPWSDLQLSYFAGCAMWTYLNTPFLLARPGIESKEIEPWHEAGETWRRLKVRFPADIATHSTEQTLYFDQQGFLKRHDYDVEISGGTGPHTTSPISRSSPASSFRRRGGSLLAIRKAIPRPNHWSSPFLPGSVVLS